MHNWTYTYIGGVPRVKVVSGEDIAHLAELDQKLWTVLSCPVSGLEIDEKSLAYIDLNADGQVHVNEVTATATWLTTVLRNPDLLIPGTDTVRLADLNTDAEDGAALAEAARRVLTLLGKPEAEAISLADSSACLESVMNARLEALRAERAAATEVKAPFADTEAVAKAYAALDPKVRDYFMRARLAAFATESAAALDVQTAQIEAISPRNLADETEAIAACPLQRVTDKPELRLAEPVNPAWAADWAAVTPALAGPTVSEADWAALGDALKAYADYTASLEVTEADIELDDETKAVQLVDRLLHLTRDFSTLLQNYVSLADFYTEGRKAVFQAGTLYIDQRACELCIRVNDAAAMAASAHLSNMFLVFCDCTSRVKGETMKVVAAVTVGSVHNIFVGKNAIFYDRAGHDWDAVVTAVVDNPISVGQAAWTPYRKVASFVEDKINALAAEKESSVIEGSVAKVDAGATAAQADVAAAGSPAGAKAAGQAAVSGFDIAKFAGIFAAIGMAIGFIGQALVAVAKGFMGLTYWQLPLVIITILLLISGPSMFVAWLKLRKRNLAPVLNANGWAVNAEAKINTKFGSTLTSQAHFPLSSRMKKQDPFADRGLPLWVHLLYILLLITAVGVALWLVGVFSPAWLPQSPLIHAADAQSLFLAK